MDLREFTFLVRDNIGDYLLDYDVENIYERDVIKNNGVIYKGIVITLKDREAAPTIYMDYYYNLYKRGKNLEEIMKLITENYKKSADKLEQTELEAGNLEKYRENLFIKVVNYKKNKTNLEDCPHIRFMDLALTFRYLVHMDEDNISSAMVKTSLMESWDLNTKMLYKISRDNTRKLFPLKIRKMSDIIRAYDTEKCVIPDDLMYVLSNEYGVNGASYIVYKDVLEGLYEKFGKDYYILPSSIHELIIIPGFNGDADTLKMFVKGVNETAVPLIDYLSDNVYYYSHESGIKII